MFKMIVVDDEPLVQVGLQSILNYDNLNMEIVGIANNGQQAIELIHSLQPALVLMDINIPIVNGLEVMEVIKKNMENPPLFIILSCHDEFQYAKKALQNGAFDYLLKIELTPSGLEETLKKAITVIEKTYHHSTGSNDYDFLYQKKMYLIDNFFLKLLNNWFDSSEVILEMMTDLQIEFDGNFYTAAYFGIPEQQKLPDRLPKTSIALTNLSNLMTELCKKYCTCYISPWNFYSFAAILCFKTSVDNETISNCIKHIQNMILRYQNIELYAGVGSTVTALDQISSSFNESMTAYHNCSKTNPVVVYSALSKNMGYPFNIAVIRHELTTALDNYDILNIRKILDQIPELIHNYIPNTEQAIGICSNIMHFIGISYKGSEHILDDIFIEQNSYYSLYKCKTILQITEWFRNFENTLCKKIREDFESKKNWLLPSIKKYVEEHYKEPITLTDVADSFSVSSGYISSIFKKNSGIGFSECVTQAKIRHAKQLLLQPNAKIYDVATQLGYSDPYYFSKVFKKTTHCSPREYMLRKNTSETIY